MRLEYFINYDFCTRAQKYKFATKPKPISTTLIMGYKKMV